MIDYTKGGIEVLGVKGIIKAELFRAGKKIWEDIANNLVPNAAKNYALDAAFTSGTQITTWYIGLIDNSSPPTLAAADTMASNSITENVAYAESTRQSWGVAVASQQATNSVAASFTFSSAGSWTIYGIFVTDNDTKSNFASGLLWSEGAFSSARTVVTSDVLKVTYTAAL